MAVVMTMIMTFVIMVMIVFVIIVIAMILFMVIMIFFMVIMIFFMVIMIFFMVIMIFFMIIVVIIDMNLAVKVFSLSPNQSRPNGSFDRERAAIIEAPLKNATKHAINGVMLGISLKVDVKTTMPFDGDDGSEVEFTGLKRLSTTTMGAMGLGR